MEVTIHGAKTNLSRLIEQATAGETPIIARGSTPVAREPGTLRGLVQVDETFFEPLPDAELRAWNGE